MSWKTHPRNISRRTGEKVRYQTDRSKLLLPKELRVAVAPHAQMPKNYAVIVKLEEETAEEKAGIMRTQPLVELMIENFLDEYGGFRTGDSYVIYARNKISREWLRNKLLNLDPVPPENIIECRLENGVYIPD